jgi:D-alanine-D-alanine ligase
MSSLAPSPRTPALLASAAARDELARRGVAVLSGGRSSERAVSLRSGEAIVRALRREAADDSDARATSLVEPGPAEVVDVECGEDGTWTLHGCARSPGECLSRLAPDTVFLLALHGGEGENGTIQGLLDAHGRVYTGSGVAASALCMNKHATRLVLHAAGLAIAPAKLIHPAEWSAHASRLLAQIGELSRQGWSVKPNSGGSSVSTFLVEREADLKSAIETVLATGDRALVEQRILGTEVTCGVLGNERGRLRALAPVEIVPHAGRFFDYEEKYSANGADEHCPPRSLSRGESDRIQELACVAHRAAGCDGYSRTDFMVPRGARGEHGEPIVLEINTLPGMTARSLMPKAAAAEGMSLRDLLLEILALSIDRFGARA